MSDNAKQSSEMDKLFRTIRVAIILSLAVGTLYVLFAILLPKWSDARSAGKTDTLEAKLKKEEDLRRKIGDDALTNVQSNGPLILNQAYPLAFGKLTYSNAELLGVGGLDGGYIATVRLRYQNLLNLPQILEIAFDYDSLGGYRSSRFVKHSDIFAPEELTLGKLLKLGGK